MLKFFTKKKKIQQPENTLLNEGVECKRPYPREVDDFMVIHGMLPVDYNVYYNVVKQQYEFIEKRTGNHTAYTVEHIQDFQQMVTYRYYIRNDVRDHHLTRDQQMHVHEISESHSFIDMRSSRNTRHDDNLLILADVTVNLTTGKAIKCRYMHDDPLLLRRIVQHENYIV